MRTQPIAAWWYPADNLRTSSLIHSDGLRALRRQVPLACYVPLEAKGGVC